MRLRSLLVACMTVSAFLVGCEDSSSSETPAPSSQGQMSPEVASASTVAVDAFQTLFQQDGGSVDASNPLGSSQASLQSANASLRSAWNSNNSDSRAAFGLAITGLALKINDMAGTLQRAQDNGLSLGGATTAVGASASETIVASSTPSAIEKSMPALARAMATPAKAPLVHELQDSLEQLLIPTLDEAISLLGVSWADPSFEFHVALDSANFPGDTLVIDRSDVGFALSILQALRAEIRWVISYNFDVDKGGSYAWADTLSNISSLDSISVAQEAALQHFEGLLSNSSSFLAVRAGKEATLASVPVELKASLLRIREASLLAYSLKAGKENHIPTITTTAVRDSFLRVVDSGISWLSGPRNVAIYSRVTCQDTSWNVYDGETYGYSFTRTSTNIGLFSNGCDSYSDDVIGDGYEYHSRSYQLSSRTQTIYMDLSKLLALPDLKVFLPRFQWNATSTWDAKGPVSLVNAAGIPMTSVDFVKAADSLGYDGVKTSIYWADPTFGGAFPNFKTSLDVMEYFRNAIENDASSATVAARGPLALF